MLALRSAIFHQAVAVNWTVKVRVAWCDRFPDVPVTVNVEVPAGAPGDVVAPPAVPPFPAQLMAMAAGNPRPRAAEHASALPMNRTHRKHRDVFATREHVVWKFAWRN